MSYRLEWISGIGVFGTVILLLIVPEFAMIAVLVVALVVLVALVALTAAVLASPYLLVRSLRRRRAQSTTRRSTRRRSGGVLGEAAEGLHR
jgi:membrane protein implicated in regulation of membrane protease activity